MIDRRLCIFAAVLATLVAAVAANGASAESERLAELETPGEVAGAVFPSLNTYWSEVFAASGLTYRAPRGFWWYNRASNRRWVPIARECDFFQTKGDGRMWGGQRREYKPNSFYCPVNEQVYLDWKFLNQLVSVDDARVALVLAHEFAHHIQHQLGWPNEMRAMGHFAGFELHADCYAGAWFGYAEERGLLERGDLLNAGVMLGYLGDPDGTPWNEPGAHGGRSERQEWFLYGYEQQDPSSCDAVFA